MKDSEVKYYLLAISFVLFFSSCRFINKPSGVSLGNPDSVGYIGIFGRDTVELTKIDGSWILDGKYEADPVAVDNFLYAFQNLEIRGATSGTGIDSLFSRKIIIETSRKKKIYRYYSGNNASFLHHEGSSKIFRVTIKGAPGAEMQQVFSDDPGYWRNRMIISVEPNELKEIAVIPCQGMGKGFFLRKDSTVFNLYDLSGEEIEKRYMDREKILLYISYLGEIFYEEEIEDDSIINRVLSADPFYSFDIKLTTGKTEHVEVYPLYSYTGDKDMFFGAIKIQDTDRILKINYAYLDVLFQELDYFITVE